MTLLPYSPDGMFCWSWDRVYVKSNGRIPCWCDAGESYTIIAPSFGDQDFVTDIVNSPNMIEMRLSILRDNRYYISACANCCCLTAHNKGEHSRYKDCGSPNLFKIQQQSNHAMAYLNKVAINRDWLIGSIDHISEIQLEPSFPCNLKCPGCLQGWHPDPMKTEAPPYVFPLVWFTKMIDSILKHKVQLDRISYVGRGEPTLNKQLPNMIAYLRQAMPETKQMMDTNSNQEFKPEYLQLDWINCSIDGASTESYPKYRRGGKFERAMDFLQTASRAKHAQQAACEIRWKYILFNTTDDELNEAQRIAKQFEVDRLEFIITHCGSADGVIAPSSKYLTVKAVDDYLAAHPIFENTRVTHS